MSDRLMRAPRCEALLPWLRLVFIALLIGLNAGALPQASLAQEARDAAIEAPDYQRWTSVAGRAEDAVARAEDDTAVFETLRMRIATFRAAFDAARQTNAERIATLRQQIDALGAVPAEGESEAEEIAGRRAALNAQLAELLVPVQSAEEAFTRASGIIREIDLILRARQQERLLELGPTPLNPALWGPAVQELTFGLAEIGAERRVFSNPRLMEEAREALPLVLFLTLLGLVLLIRGRRWAVVMGGALRRFGGRGTGVWGFVVSLLRIALPLAGVYALCEAARASGLVATRGAQILELLPVWAALLLGYRWLAERLFARSDEDAILLLADGRRSEARFYLTLLAIVGVLRGVVELIGNMENFSAGSDAVVGFVFSLSLGILLFRFGQLLSGYARSALPSRDDAGADLDFDEEAPPPAAPADEGAQVGSGFARILRYFGRALQIVSLLAPALSALGYATAADMMLYPALLTFGLFGLVLVFQRFVTDVVGWLTGRGDAVRDSLASVLINFLFVLAAAPVLALIWGTRPADLLELWTGFLAGFQIGGTRISPSNFIGFVILFTIGYLLTRIVQNALRTSVLPKTRLDTGGKTAIVSGVGYVGYFLSALIAITMAGIDLSALAIVAGALSVGIGFGLQNIVNNFVSGIILLIERPIAEGDWIEVGGNMGYVRNISVRSTRIETFDRSDVIVPNSDLISGTVTNYTRGNTVGRVIVPVGVAYGSDTREVERILREVANAHPMVLVNPPPSVVFQNFGASSLDFEIRAILRDVNWMLSVKSEMNHQIAKRFEEAGIEIPFPQQDVWLRNPEQLRKAPDLEAQESDRGDSSSDTDSGDAP